jgi:murein DD-endopeptidase MepM/ murein hydrolase activator NlpD
MRLLTLTCALALALAPAAAAQPSDFVPALPPEAVHPVDGQVGYGEWAARFGNFRHGHVHAGQDTFAPAGTPLLAVRDAVVIEKGAGDGRGNYIALYSKGERETYVYLHLERPAPVEIGDSVTAGQRVGRLGCTGSCFGDHLHFEVRAGRGTTGRPSDPLPLLRKLPRGS